MLVWISYWTKSGIAGDLDAVTLVWRHRNVLTSIAEETRVKSQKYMYLTLVILLFWAKTIGWTKN